MNILICDNDKQILDKLSLDIRDYFTQNKYNIPEIYVFENEQELLNSNISSDVVFLNTEPPYNDGISLGYELKKIKPNTIIFIISSYMKYLDDAMDLGITRYLLKPIDKNRLYVGLNRAISIYNSYSTRIMIETKEICVSVNTYDIIYAEVYNRKVVIHTASRDYYSIYNFEYWCKALKSPVFYRSHRCYIINMAHVSSYNCDNIGLYHDRFYVLLSRRKYVEFKKIYNMFIENNSLL